MTLGAGTTHSPRFRHAQNALWRDGKRAEDTPSFQACLCGTNFNNSGRHHFGKEDKFVFRSQITRRGNDSPSGTRRPTAK